METKFREAFDNKATAMFFHLIIKDDEKSKAIQDTLYPVPAHLWDELCLNFKGTIEVNGVAAEIDLEYITARINSHIEKEAEIKAKEFFSRVYATEMMEEFKEKMHEADCIVEDLKESLSSSLEILYKKDRFFEGVFLKK